MSVSQPTILTLTLTTQNTEYSVTLPPCTRFEIQPRTSVDLKLAYQEGDTGSGRPFRTIKAALPPYREDAVLAIPRTLYLQCGTNGTVVEIVCWA